MSVLNSWCERLCVFSFIVLVSIISLDYKFYFLPINGLWLLLYVVCIIISTIWITCVDIQKLLEQNIPFEYNIESNKLYQKLQSLYKLITNLFTTNACTKDDIIKNNIKNTSQTPIIENKTLVDSVPIETKLINISQTKTTKEKTIDERIEILVRDIEQKFISKWYNLISEEETFPAESKILLEGIIRRVLQVSVQMDGSKIICGVLIILLKHLKEYRRAIKRVNKNGGSIESVYRYSHIGNKSDEAMEHFTHRLTAHVLREFISWELWNSLPCRLLVSILSKRLTKYMLFFVSQPGWLNYKLVYQSSTENDISYLKLDKYMYISLSDVDLSDKQIKQEEEPIKPDKEIKSNSKKSSTPQLSPKRDTNISLIDSNENNPKDKFSKIDTVIQSDSESVIEKALTKMITQQTAPILQRAEKSNHDLKSADNGVVSTENSAHATPKHEISVKRSEPVKIHSAKSSSKRWDENNSELSNVSLGQDLLALEGLDSSGVQGFSGRRLWGYSAEINEPENDKWEVNETWLRDSDKFTEKDIIIEEGRNVSPPKANERKKFKESLKKASPPSSIPHCLRPATTSATAFVTNTIKPIALKPTFLAGNVTATTLHNMREFQQSTVNNVVKPVSHVAEKAVHKIGDLQDEAVGVVEGIFDFGMAGIRKGLRLTGLQDINEMSTQKHTKSHHVVHESVKQSPKNVPKLVKLGHVTSSSEDAKPLIKNVPIDSVESCWINPLAKDSPNGYENQMLLEHSPSVPETDTTTVEHATEVPGITETNLFLTDSPEYEETADLASTISKLRSLLQQKSSESSLNTPAVSPMLIDDKSCPTPTEPTVTDGTGMQRFARTVTGMFNTFKTALPGNMSENMQAKNDQQWIFVENETSDTDLPSLLNSLLVERRDYCTIDTAYEAMDSLDVLTESVSSQIGKIQWDNRIYEDELDDLETSIPITKALLDVMCECLQDTNCAFKQEPVLKALLILGGAKAEKNLNYYSEKSLRFINKAIGPLPKNIHDLALPMELNEMVEIIEKSFPYYLKEIFGHDDIKTGLKFFLSSLQSIKINQDIMLQFFELICSQLTYASSQMSPTPSA